MEESGGRGPGPGRGRPPGPRRPTAGPTVRPARGSGRPTPVGRPRPQQPPRAPATPTKGTPPPQPRRPAAARTPPRPRKRRFAEVRLGDPVRRIRVALLVMAFVLSLFAGRLIQIQGLDSKTLEARGLEYRERLETLKARRGMITDVKGNPLALTSDAREVYVDPKEVAKSTKPGADEVARFLAQTLQRSPEEILAKLKKTTTQYQVIARNVDPAVGAQIAAKKWVGVRVKPHYRRLYPAGDLAGGLVGFVNAAGKGASGLELQWNDVLAGKDGKQTVEAGQLGERIPLTRSAREAPVPGKDLRLTIDGDIQWAAQEALADQVKRTGAKSGSIVVMDVRSADLLAVANAPELDLEAWEEAPEADRTSRAVTDVFEPGSTNKVITAAAALETGVARPDSVMRVRDRIRCADRVLKDAHAHKPENLTFSGVLATSSNVGTVMAANQVGSEGLHRFLRAFGFGDRTGVGYPGEADGLLPAPQTWSGSQRCTVSYGQGVAVTALQMASVYQTIANGGVRLTPNLVAGTTGENGEFVAAERPEGVRVVSERTARELSLMLEAATTQGTGARAQVPGYRVAGKTGTAQRWDSECRGYCGYTATFVGFAPADRPSVVALVVLQAPSNGYYGGDIAAPVFKRVMSFALKSRKVPPTGTTPPQVRIRADG
ncbi:peptidoglycan D,D-transpeptidase FtsI family protein [Rhizohabitans arisaemae]|uniref:peptidoglycan D,D-transpeptidase FtsI family protein n=1 Tax=Rhizohabitans arisaemae TaxID=2720610 RepID=UPI0024B211E2|nr:penicillin-binding protein 2 [Rhizohabitans arisaemae]